MAIKPSDTIIPYGKLKRYEDVSPKNSNYFGHFQVVYDVEYLRNFDQYINQLVNQKVSKSWDETEKVRKAVLKQYNAEYKEFSDPSKTYIKFKRESDYTFFILKFS